VQGTPPAEMKNLLKKVAISVWGPNKQTPHHTKSPKKSNRRVILSVGWLDEACYHSFLHFHSSTTKDGDQMQAAGGS